MTDLDNILAYLNKLIIEISHLVQKNDQDYYRGYLQALEHIRKIVKDRINEG